MIRLSTHTQTNLEGVLVMYVLKYKTWETLKTTHMLVSIIEDLLSAHSDGNGHTKHLQMTIIFDFLVCLVN